VSYLVLGAALNTRASVAAVSGLSSDGRLPWEKGERSDEACSRMLNSKLGFGARDLQFLWAACSNSLTIACYLLI
jgi:hypothetical protein